MDYDLAFEDKHIFEVSTKESREKKHRVREKLASLAFIVLHARPARTEDIDTPEALDEIFKHYTTAPKVINIVNFYFYSRRYENIDEQERREFEDAAMDLVA